MRRKKLSLKQYFIEAGVPRCGAAKGLSDRPLETFGCLTVEIELFIYFSVTFLLGFISEDAPEGVERAIGKPSPRS